MLVTRRQNQPTFGHCCTIALARGTRKTLWNNGLTSLWVGFELSTARSAFKTGYLRQVGNLRHLLSAERSRGDVFLHTFYPNDPSILAEISKQNAAFDARLQVPAPSSGSPTKRSDRISKRCASSTTPSWTSWTGRSRLRDLIAAGLSKESDEGLKHIKRENVRVRCVDCLITCFQCKKKTNSQRLSSLFYLPLTLVYKRHTRVHNER